MDADDDAPDDEVPTEDGRGVSGLGYGLRAVLASASAAKMGEVVKSMSRLQSVRKPWVTEAFKQYSTLDSIGKPWVTEAFKQYSTLDSIGKPWVTEAFKQYSALDSIGKPWVTEAFKQYSALDSVAKPGLFRILEHQQSQLRAVVESVARHARLFYPANVRDIDDLRLSEIDVVVMEDGIPLYGVPRLSIARSLLRARDRASRRAILGRRWREIADDCEAYLATVTVAELDSERTFALKAVAALRDGHVEAGQALAANLLDTIVTKYFAADRLILKPSKKVVTPPSYDDFMVRKYWAVAPIWSAYQQFFPQNGDPVPRRFARHASAHAVSRAQFSRRNAVQAIMLVSSLLGYLEEERSGTWR